jgi:hypothetical protein
MKEYFLLFLVFILALAIYWRWCQRSYSGASEDCARADVVKNLKSHPRSKTEARIISLLEEILHMKFPTVNPKWLCWKGKPMELDGYNEEAKLAIEVDGWWHHHWEPNKEEYTAYYERLVKDVAKDRLCKRRGVSLIRVDSKLPARHWRNYLLSRLHDVGAIPDEPAGYIPKQTYESFHNEEIEAQLGLAKDMEMALSL